jgi:hypothetical protein
MRNALMSSSRASGAESSPVSSPLVRWLILVTLFALPVIAATRPVADPDIWWHLRIGEWVVKHGAVTETDPLSQLAGPWVAYSWLHEVVVYGSYHALGLAGIVGFRVLISLAVVWALYALVRRIERRFLYAVGLTAVATLALYPLFTERPGLFTVLFTALTLHAVVALRQEEDRPPRWVWALPVFYVLWANMHIQFVYGLFVLFLACAVPPLEKHLGWRQSDQSAATPGSRRWWQLVGLSALCFAATFVNPYHVGLYGVVIEYATQPGPFQWITELKALEFRDTSSWVVLALTGMACFMLGRRAPSLFGILLVVATAILAFRAQRDVWFVILADLVVLASAGPREVPDFQRHRPSIFAGGGLLLALAASTGLLFRARDLSNENLERKVSERFPADAARWVAHRGYKGPLYNDFNWGGYLTWALPGLPVHVDGRTNLHGDERIESNGEVWAGMPGWDSDPDLSAAGVVIARRTTPLAALLELDGRFRLEFEDDAGLACVFVRQDGFAQGGSPSRR